MAWYERYEQQEYRVESEQSEEQLLPTDPDEKETSDEDRVVDFQNRFHGESGFEHLNRQRQTREFTDIVLRVGEEEFPCHRAVLAWNSYFRAMFAHTKEDTVQLEGVSVHVFDKLLNYLYTGKITVTTDDAQDILAAATMFQFDRVVADCEEVFLQNLEAANCLKVLCIADVYSCTRLKERAVSMALEVFQKVLNSEEMLELPADLFIDYISDKKLVVKSEDDAFKVALRWLNKDVNKRVAHLPRILDCLRLTQVKESLLAKLAGHAAVRDLEDCQVKIRAARQQQHDSVGGDNCDDFSQVSLREKMSPDVLIVVGGWAVEENLRFSEDEEKITRASSPLGSILCYDLDSGVFYKSTDLPTAAMGYISTVLHKGRLYVTGGMAKIGNSQDVGTSEMFCYDFVSDTWTRLEDMPRARQGHQSIVVDNKLYVLGGHTIEHHTADCYDIADGCWSPCRSSPQPVSRLSLVKAVEGKLVVLCLRKEQRPAFRGISPREQKTLVLQCYDPATDSWTSEQTATQCDSPLLAFELDGVLYIGSEFYYWQLYQYDVRSESDGLRVLSSQSFPSSEFTVEPEYRTIRMLSGAPAGEPHDMIHRYIFERKGWEKKVKWERDRRRTAHLPFGLLGHCLVVARKTVIGWFCRDLRRFGDPDDQDTSTTPPCEDAWTIPDSDYQDTSTTRSNQDTPTPAPDDQDTTAAPDDQDSLPTPDPDIQGTSAQNDHGIPTAGAALDDQDTSAAPNDLDTSVAPDDQNISAGQNDQGTSVVPDGRDISAAADDEDTSSAHDNPSEV
ncbi:KLHL30 [Branchiostoma lanceolatum]|uniref:KLHL30 protein n=1 Tax=Branchiostoma lanceolatum TaxID=7740 RepID=A0A8J9ZJG4_BRALA|nr:KLHL30 [Branchiostoma lanceolatum]